MLYMYPLLISLASSTLLTLLPCSLQMRLMLSLILSASTLFDRINTSPTFLLRNIFLTRYVKYSIMSFTTKTRNNYVSCILIYVIFYITSPIIRNICVLSSINYVFFYVLLGDCYEKQIRTNQNAM